VTHICTPKQETCSSEQWKTLPDYTTSRTCIPCTCVHTLRSNDTSLAQIRNYRLHFVPPRGKRLETAEERLQPPILMV